MVKEGTGTKRIGIDSIDKPWLEDIAKAMDFTGPIVELHRENGFSKDKLHTMYRFKISSPMLYNDLIRQGCVEHKSSVLCFPSEKQVPKQYLNSFICGYMDGNGSVFKTAKDDKVYYKLSFCGSKGMIEGISNFFNSSVKIESRWPERDNNNRQISWHGIHTVYDKLKILYADTPIKMERKYEIFLQLSKDSRIIQ